MRLVDRGRRVVQGALDDNITGEAAKAAFYFFLSLFPLTLVGFAVATLIGGERLFDNIIAWLTDAMPADATLWFEDWLREVAEQPPSSVLSVSALLTVWAASNFFAAIGDALDTMFGVRERASWWKKRLKAILLMAIGGVVLIGGALALIAGPQIAGLVGLGEHAHLLAWPIVFLLLVGLLWLIYYVMPAHDQSRLRTELLAGAVFGAAVWIIAAVGFRFYVGNFGNFGRVYGFIGGIIVLLLWLYMSAIAILLGGEVAEMLAEEREEQRGTGSDGVRDEERGRRAA
jgi:membrane protein